MVEELVLKIKADVKDFEKGIESALSKSGLKKQGNKFLLELVPQGGAAGRFTGGVQAGAFGTGKVTGGAGAVGKMAGSLALIGGAVTILTAIAGKILNTLAESSPALKGTLMLFQRAMTLFFKPFGDALSQVLRPAAVASLLMAVEFIKFSRKFAKSPTETLASLIGFDLDPSQLPEGQVKEFVLKFQTFLDNFLFNLGNIGFLTNPAPALELIWDGFLLLLEGVLGKDFIEDLKTTFKNFIADTSKALLGFGTWLFETITNINNYKIKILKTFGQWLFDTITGIFTESFNVLKNLGQIILDMILGQIMGDRGPSPSVSGTFTGGDASSFIRQLNTQLKVATGGAHRATAAVADDFISRSDGTIQRFSPDDNIIGVKDMGSLGGSNITINISGENIFESPEKIRQLAELLADEANLNLKRRSML